MFEPNEQNTVELLDAAVIDDQSVLLNGHGCPLETDETPVYLTFRQGEAQHNSRGDLFAPQWKWGDR